MKKCAKIGTRWFWQAFECAAPECWSKYATEGDGGGKEDHWPKFYNKVVFLKHACWLVVVSGREKGLFHPIKDAPLYTMLSF